MKSKRKVNKGFSLVEVVVALAILTIVATSVLAGFVQSSRINMKSLYLQDATEIAQAVAENLKKRSYSEFVEYMKAKKDSDPGSELEVTKLYDDDLEENRRKGLEGVSMENVKLSDIFADESKYIMDGPDFKVDILMDSANYANGKKTTTYKQSTGSLSKDYDVAAGTKVVASNSFLIPVIKETDGQCVIYSYDDGEAISEIINTWATKYATARSLLAPIAGRAAAYSAAESEFKNYATSTMFPEYKIIDSTATPKVLRTLTVDVTYTAFTPISGGSAYKVDVVLKGKYELNKDALNKYTYNGYSDFGPLDFEKELYTYSYNLYPDAEGNVEVQDIYLYLKPIQVFKAGANYMADQNSVKVTYSGTDALPESYKSKCYIVMQQVIAEGKLVLPVYGVEPLTKGSGNPVVYTNMQKNGNLVLNSDGYLTDGGSNEVTMYDMTIVVKYQGKEYARFTTTKED